MSTSAPEPKLSITLQGDLLGHMLRWQTGTTPKAFDALVDRAYDRSVKLKLRTQVTARLSGPEAAEVRLFVEKTHKEEPDERCVANRLMKALENVRSVYQ
jgi:hypothetical protein